MSRNKGTFNFAANFEVLNKAPLDARLVVDTKENLITPSVWQDVASNVWLYKGIVVSVVSDPSAENNGLYFLTDETQYTDYNYWLKLGSSLQVDPSGTSWATFQLNNGDNGVILKDVSGNLEVVAFDGVTYANLKAGHLDINSIKIDNLTGSLYAQDGSVYVVPGTYNLLAYRGFILGNGNAYAFPVVHDLSTLDQTISVWEKSSNEEIYPDIIRGSSTNTFVFSTPPGAGVEYDVTIMGF